jgi:hypothetical protein
VQQFCNVLVPYQHLDFGIERPDLNRWSNRS